MDCIKTQLLPKGMGGLIPIRCSSALPIMVIVVLRCNTKKQLIPYSLGYRRGDRTVLR